MVPFRFIGETLGATVDWEAATSTAIFMGNGTTVRLTIGQELTGSDGTAMGTPIIDAASGRTLVPVRFVSEAMGATVDWDAATRAVTITFGGTATPPVVTPPVVEENEEEEEEEPGEEEEEEEEEEAPTGGDNIFELGAFCSISGEHYRWNSHGHEDSTLELTTEILERATHLVVVLSGEPANNVDVILFGYGNNWNWGAGQVNGAFGPGRGLTFTYDLRAHSQWNTLVGAGRAMGIILQSRGLGDVFVSAHLILED
jgi:hypothetical protein